jgi:hypothetical protein
VPTVDDHRQGVAMSAAATESFGTISERHGDGWKEWARANEVSIIFGGLSGLIRGFRVEQVSTQETILVSLLLTS